MKGVINLRGTVIAVLDLRAKFQFAAKDYRVRSCIIVVQVAAPSGGNTLMGAIVDAVEEVVQLTADDSEEGRDFVKQRMPRNQPWPSTPYSGEFRLTALHTPGTATSR